jgi:ketosteroid isomerase-like protein
VGYDPLGQRDQLRVLLVKLKPASPRPGAIEAEHEHAVAQVEQVGQLELPGLPSYLHPEVEIHPAVGGELDFGSTYRGRDGMRQFMETGWRGFDMAVEPEEIVSAPGDRIIATERWQLRARDGVEAELQLTDVYAFRDGLIVGIDGFREKAEALEAAGLSE